MENIDNMAKNSLTNLSRRTLTEKEEKKIKQDIISGGISITCLIIGLLSSNMAPGKEVVAAFFYTIGFLVQGIPIFMVAVKGILAKEIKNSMEILVATAIIACYCTVVCLQPGVRLSADFDGQCPSPVLWDLHAGQVQGYRLEKALSDLRHVR